MKIELYCLLVELANEECDLIGIRLINEGGLNFINLSWVAKEELCLDVLIN